MFYDTALGDLLMTMNILASLVAVTKRAREMMPDGGNILALTCYSAE